MARKAITGTITKISGLKTYRVTVVYSKLHAKYKKIVSYQRSYLAHSENAHNVGEVVTLKPSSRRLSKHKNFIIVEKTNKVEAK